MKLKIVLASAGNITLPRNYNHILQSWLYNQISDPAYQAFLHDQGFSFEKRKFKMFTFSRLLGRWALDPAKKNMIFGNHVTLYIASPLLPLMEEVAFTLLSGLQTRLGTNQVIVSEIQSDGDDVLPSGTHKWRISALSPIVAYSTLTNNGKKETRYYRPDEPEFNALVKSNLQKKSSILLDEGLAKYGPLTGDFVLRPLFDPAKTGSTALYYKEFFIRGYMGKYEVECDACWMRVALDTGLGSKNAQGLGMVELVE